VKLRSTLIPVLAGVLVIGLLVSPPAAARGGVADERFAGATIALTPQVAYEKATLRVKGARELSISKEFAAGEAISLALVDEAGAALPDGRYRYSLRVSPRPEAGGGFQSGLFYIENGSAVARDVKRAELGNLRAELNQQRQQTIGAHQAGQRPGSDGAVPPPPTAYSNNYHSIFDTSMDSVTLMTLYSYSYNAWDFYNNNGDLRIQRYPIGFYGEPALFIDNYDNYVGIGTDDPYGSLMISSPYSPEIYFFDPSTYNYIEVEFWSSGDLAFHQYYGTTLFLDAYDEAVGINTTSPGADLEVYDGGSYAAMRLNNGIANWAFSNTPAGVFTVNKVGSGGQEFTVGTRFDAGGNTMQVQGSVQGTKFVATSSREMKTDFTTLDGQEVLAKLAEIPVMSWRYKTDDETDRHFGPVAEDFQSAFQLGDGKTIANIDADGVALAAIQGLHSMLEEKSAALEELRAEKDQEIADLTKRLAVLEEHLQAHPPGNS
jgi:hypothetical protein